MEAEPVHVPPLRPLTSFEPPKAQGEDLAPAGVSSLAPVASQPKKLELAAKADPADDLVIPGVPPRGQLGVRAIVVGLVLAAVVAVGVKVMRNDRARALAKAAATQPPAAPAETVPATAAPTAAPSAVAAMPVTTATEVASAAPGAAPSTEASAAPTAPASAIVATSADVKVDSPDAARADAKSLRDEALHLLANEKNREAMVRASEALEADPTDAMPYLVLGSALQDVGRWKEATHLYQACVKTAKRGMVDECRAMLHKR